MAFWGTAAQVVGVASGLSNLFGDDGGSSGGAQQQVAQSNALIEFQAQMGREAWDLYKTETLPLIRQAAANITTPDRTAEEEGLAAGAVKDQFAIARRGFERTIGQEGRDPGSPGYAAALAPSYMDEAAQTAGAITNARRAERARKEDTEWGRRIQVVGMGQGLPQQANTNLSSAAAGSVRSASALTDLARLSDARRAQGVYGGFALAKNASKWFGGPDKAPSSSGSGYYDPGWSDYSGGYENYGYDASGWGGTVDDPWYGRDGGVVRRRPRYADGGDIEGGVIDGPGTGTSDSVATQKRPGTFILSADTVRAIGTKKVRDLMEKAGVRPGEGENPDAYGQAIRASKGEAALPPEVVQYHGEEFFRKLQQKYHRPVASDGMANGGAIRARGLPSAVEDAIFAELPARALGTRRYL